MGYAGGGEGRTMRAVNMRYGGDGEDHGRVVNMGFTSDRDHIPLSNIMTYTNSQYGVWQ